MLPSSMHTPWAGSDSYNLSELNTVQGSTVSRYLSSSLPFCVRFNVAVTRHAATLDTEPLAKSYSGGRRTHLSSNHFQYARARFCSVFAHLSNRKFVSKEKIRFQNGLYPAFVMLSV